ncbi:MAG: cytochrome c oxidase subunit 3 [Desulfuromonadales bacterium]
MSEAAHKDYAGAKLGMWLFLYTEILLFGGLFVLYAVYLFRFPAEFARASNELSLTFGTVNTLILLTSSLAAAAAVTAVQKGARQLTFWLLVGTVITAAIFLVNKYFEWSAKFHHGIYLNGPGLAEAAPGEVIFFSLYFITTGLHGLHVLIGAILLTVIAGGVRKGAIHTGDYVKLENSALYWHLVDLVWIFVFPLYYLIL